MERNPYSAPAAPVADAAPETPPERPSAVTLALRLLWTSAALSTGAIFIQPVIPGDQPGFGMGVKAAIALISLAIWAWFLWKIGVGRNWARIVYLVLTVLGYLSLIFTWKLQVQLFQAGPLWGAITVVGAAISIYALYLLFTPAASPWFRQGGTAPVR